jgi:hypothetical protein
MTIKNLIILISLVFIDSINKKGILFCNTLMPYFRLINSIIF